jgi:FkbM family methyltransferase
MEVYREEGIFPLVSKIPPFLMNEYHVRWKHRNTDSVSFDCAGVTATFDTSTVKAKNWFFPRYTEGRLHEPALTVSLLRVLAPDSTFYDIGANVGYFTVLGSEVCVNGSVHAFEVDPELVKALEYSLERNGTSATVVQSAVSDFSEDTLTVTAKNVPTVVADAGSGEYSGKTVTTVTLDDYCDAGNPIPDVIKMDIEGHELRALQGAENVISSPNQKVLFIEVHPEKLAERGDNATNVMNYLSDAGYECYRFVNHRSDDIAFERTKVREATVPRENTMFFCTKHNQMKETLVINDQ